MGNFGKFGGGGMGNIQQMMKQAQKMQEQMKQAQAELEEIEVTGTAAGGMVTVTMTGKKVVTAIKIKPEAVDPEDIEMLEDLIIAALNDATERADEVHDEKMGAFGGLL